MSQHALQDLEQLIAETAELEKEKKTLEFVLRDSRTGKDSIGYKTKLLLIVPEEASCINMLSSHYIDITLNSVQ